MNEAQTKVADQTEARNMETMRAVIEEGFNRGNFPALDDLFVLGYVEHQFGLSTDLEGMKRDIAWLRRAFPDLHLTIDEMQPAGDKVWLRMTARGTNTGPMMGPPTNKPMQITVFDLCRFQDGKICEHWGVPDRFAQLAQLGLLPKPQGAPEKTEA